MKINGSGQTCRLPSMRTLGKAMLVALPALALLTLLGHAHFACLNHKFMGVRAWKLLATAEAGLFIADLAFLRKTKPKKNFPTPTGPQKDLHLKPLGGGLFEGIPCLDFIARFAVEGTMDHYLLDHYTPKQIAEQVKEYPAFKEKLPKDILKKIEPLLREDLKNRTTSS